MTDTTSCARGSHPSTPSIVGSGATFVAGSLIGWILLERPDVLAPALGLTVAAALLALLARMRRQNVTRRAVWQQRIEQAGSPSHMVRSGDPVVDLRRPRPAIRPHATAPAAARVRTESDAATA